MKNSFTISLLNKIYDVIRAEILLKLALENKFYQILMYN